MYDSICKVLVFGCAIILFACTNQPSAAGTVDSSSFFPKPDESTNVPETTSERYWNARFAFAMNVPSFTQLKGAEPANSDGLHFSGLLGSEFTASGHLAATAMEDIEATPQQQIANAYQRAIQHADGLQIGYKAQTADGYVLSGVKNGFVIYRRYWLAQGRWVGIHFKYPKSLQPDADREVERVVASVKLLEYTNR